MDHLNTNTFLVERERGQHLRFEDRCTIQIYRKLDYSLRKIAEAINCSPSKVLNELQRGTGNRDGKHPRLQYSARRGQMRYWSNRSRCHKVHKIMRSSAYVNWVTRQMKEHNWSLDTCAGYAKKHKMFPETQMVCSKTLYNELWQGHLPLSPFDLPEALSRKPRRKHQSQRQSSLGKSIEERPEEVMERITCGHWEIDTVVDHRSGHEAVVLTLVERVTDFYLAIKIPGKTADAVMTALEVLREEFGSEHFSEVFQTITADNGSEFRRLSELEVYGIGVYFAHPYSSWERGQNERHNRIFRRFVPKGTSIENYSAEQILSYADEMNAMPRKVLGYCTPEELFNQFLDQIYALKVTAVTNISRCST